MSATPEYTPNLIDRFYAKVSKTPTETGCLEWLAYYDRFGYGSFGIGGKNVRAHRVAWEIVNGPIPAGLVIRHMCNNRLCCNPAHLETGTYADNIHDMMRSGRWHNAPNTTAPYIRPAPPTVAERFYAKVSKTQNETGCLDWLGRRNRSGYGTFTIGRKSFLAHRVAWTLTHGPIPDGMVIAHKCDRPQCTNVEHLFCGTHTDNMRDMDAKGRRAPSRGEQNPRVKLTERDVIAIRSEQFSGWSQRDIAQHFGIDQAHMGRILHRDSWTHVDADRDVQRESGHAKGERTGCAKLTEQDVIAIRSDLYKGWTLVAIAEQFGISKGQVSNILLRKKWAHLDATRDAPREGGAAKGEQAGSAKLTEQDVLAMRSDLYSGWKQADIAQHFGIGKSQVSDILLRKKWKHI